MDPFFHMAEKAENKISYWYVQSRCQIRHCYKMETSRMILMALVFFFRQKINNYFKKLFHPCIFVNILGFFNCFPALQTKTAFKSHLLLFHLTKFSFLFCVFTQNILTQFWLLHKLSGNMKWLAVIIFCHGTRYFIKLQLFLSQSKKTECSG